MKQTIIVSAASLMLTAFPAYAAPLPQPCLPYANAANLLSGTPLGSPAIGIEFFKMGKRFDIDPRAAISVAGVKSNFGRDQCSDVNNPFGPNASGECGAFSNFVQAIDDFTYRISIHIPPGNYSTIIDIARQPDMNFDGIAAARIYNFLLGNSSRPAHYSSTCCGDCDYSGQTQINEVYYMINALLCFGCPYQCALGDADFNGSLLITDIVRDLNSALYGCPVGD